MILGRTPGHFHHMQHLHSVDAVQLDSSVMTIGMFDGVHIGHQQIMHQMIQKSHQINTPSCVITFHPHPAFVLRNLNEPFYLTTPDERAGILLKYGIDYVITLPFNSELSSYPPDKFMRYLNDHLKINHLFIGSDFALGKDRKGDKHALEEIGRHMGYTIEIVQPLERYDQKVSSSLIRNVIKRGEIELAAELLGRKYSIAGLASTVNDLVTDSEVISCIEMAYDYSKIIPKPGLYAGLAAINDKEYPGFIETFPPNPNGNLPNDQYLQVSLFHRRIDFDRKEINVSFLKPIRDPIDFRSNEEKAIQLKHDFENSKEVFSHVG